MGTSWFEYGLERLRVQADLSGKTPEEVDQEERQWQVCSFRFHIEKQSPESLAGTPGCADLTAPFGGAPSTYLQAVADISLGKNWQNADVPVLVVYGTASPVTSAHQNRYFNRYRSERDYELRDQPDSTGDHPFHRGLLDLIFPWVQAH